MELPRLKVLWEKYRERGFDVIAVNQLYVDREKYLQYIADKALPFTFLIDTRETDVDSGLYGGSGHPTSFLIGKDGMVYFHHLGFKEGDEIAMEREILTLLAR